MPQQPEHLFNRRAQDYQAKYMDVGHYGDTLALFCDALPPNASVLDVACGPGNITRFLLDQRNDLQLFGTDLAPNMVALAQANNPEATFAVADMRHVAQTDSKYDAVICGFGLPYLSTEEAAAFISDLPKILRDGGHIYLSTMTADKDESRLQHSSDGKDTLLTYYHSETTLRRMLANVDFEIVLVKKQPFPDHPDTTDLIVIARRHYSTDA